MNGNGRVKSFEELFTLFEARCESKEIKESTMGAYSTTMGRFVRWADDLGIAPAELTALDVISYTGSLTRLDGSPYATNSKQTHCRDIKTLLNFAADYKVIPEKIRIEMPKTPEDEIQALNDDELESVLGFFDDRSEENPRDAAIVFLLKDSGIRAGELLGLTWEDLIFDAETYTGTVSITKQIIKSTAELGPPKNGKARKSHFSLETWNHLEALKKSFGGVPPLELELSKRDMWLMGLAEPTSHVFLKHEGDRLPLKHSGLGYMLKTAGEELGIPLRPHLLRHTTGRLLTIAEMPPIAIMQLLGHSNLDMVLRYSKLWGRDVENLYSEKMSGNGAH